MTPQETDRRGDAGVPGTVLYVGDDETAVAALSAALTDHVVRSVGAADDALAAIADGRVECVVSEQDLADGDGVQFLREVRARWPSLAFVLAPADGSERLASRAIAAGTTDYVPRPGASDAAGGESGDGADAPEGEPDDDGGSLVARVAAAVDEDHDRPDVERGFSTYQSVVEKSPVPIAVYDADAVVRYVNPAGVAFLGAADEHDVVGRPAASFLHEDHRERAVDRVHRVLDDRVAVDPVVTKFVDLDGETRHAKAASGPVTYRGDPAGQVVLNDITELVHNERELKRQNERLDEFASIVSHDLRNPLDVAMGRLELYRSRGGEHNLDEAEKALARIETIVADVLLLARNGEGVTETEAVSLTAAVESAGGTVGVPGLAVRVADDASVVADPSRLQQLLENLFRNAVEHGHPDESSVGDDPAAATVTVTLGTDLVERDGRAVTALYVEDDGVGIPPNEREDVFEPGYTTAREGTGFGLNIVQQVAEAHGWEVRIAESATGGARFEFIGVDLRNE